MRAMSACFGLSQGDLESEYPHCTAVISCWSSLSEKLFSYCIRHTTSAAPRREPQVTRNTCSYRYYREDSSATPQVKLPERDRALREKYAYLKMRWLWRGAAHYVLARVTSDCRRPYTPWRKEIPSISLLLLYRRLLPNTIYLSRRSRFFYTATPSIAVAMVVHTRYCQEDPYYPVSSINYYWRTRDDMCKKIPILFYWCMSAHDVMTSSNNKQQPVDSATLATTQQRVRNTTLRITPFELHPRLSG